MDARQQKKVIRDNVTKGDGTGCNVKYLNTERFENLTKI